MWCNDTDELPITCSDIIMEDTNVEEVKQDFNDLITTATEDMNGITVGVYQYLQGLGGQGKKSCYLQGRRPF